MIKRDLPEGMTIEDADKVYKEEKQVFIGNEGVVKGVGVECVDCHRTHDIEEMKYCPCDEGFVCSSCCGHCGYNNRGTCIWPAD